MGSQSGIALGNMLEKGGKIACGWIQSQKGKAKMLGYTYTVAVEILV